MDSSCSPQKKCWFSWMCSLIQTPLLLVIRVIWGILFIQAGIGKLMNIGGTTELFTSLDIPYPLLNAWLVGLVETIGGVMILVGYMTRLAAIPLIIILVTALFTAHHAATFNIFHDFHGFMGQAPFSFLFAMLTLLAFGPGCLSLDKICCCKKSSCGSCETK